LGQATPQRRSFPVTRSRKATFFSLDFAKQFLSETIIHHVITYLDKNPEDNLEKLFNLGERLAIAEGHRQTVRRAREAVLKNPVMKEYVVRLLRDTDRRVQHRLMYNWFVNSALLGIPRQRRMSEELGFNVPHFFLLDPTSACNLKCKGCWAGAYDKHDTLDFGRLDRLMDEAKELGIHWVVMSGGEPFLYRDLFRLCGNHPDMAFMLYTNGTLIDDTAADRMLEVGNMSPAISLEGGREATDARRGAGTFDRIMAAMDRLRIRGIPFGFSLTITNENAAEVMSDEFMDLLIDKGCRYGWTFHYIPIGRDPDTGLMVEPERRAWLAERVEHLRTHKPILFADFWNDGHLTGGCIAGGRRYFHINARGDVEPCAFVHFAVDNIKDKSLKEVLDSPLFRAYQRRQPFSENMLRPCPIIDVPEALREIVAESGARPTHPGADGVLGGCVAAFLDRRAADWAETSAPVWQRRCACRPMGAADPADPAEPGASVNPTEPESVGAESVGTEPAKAEATEEEPVGSEATGS